jgi:hypothetical protein
LQTDAYAVYGSFAKARPQVTMAGCVGPIARRKIYDAREQDAIRAKVPIWQMFGDGRASSTILHRLSHACTQW